MKSLILSLLTLAAPVAAQSPVIHAPAGDVRGTSDEAMSVFRGIPYAQPPIGNMRWRPTRPLSRWSGVREATAFGPACVQPQGGPPSVYSPAAPLPVSEDCLTLNIWAPANAAHAPVFFWIHGGALLTGSSREPMYDGAKLAAQGIIVVSINYRLGVLGWLAHPDRSRESGAQVSGNYGLLDQIGALHWVHDNIAAFGGDPAKVTIAGESAGGLSVLYLMESPLARGLFARAIAQSSYMVSMPELKRAAYGSPSWEAVGQMLQAGLQAPNLSALRGMDAQAITNNAARLGFAPFGTVDGKLLPEQMTAAFDAGHQAPVPVMAGFNQGEIRSLRMLAPPAPATAAAYEATIHAKYGDLADAFLRLYPAADYRESIIATTRDALYGWTAERIARKQTALGQPAYLYQWDHGYPAMDAAGMHAFHASELPFVFGTIATLPPRWPAIPDTAGEHALSEAMVGYWASFTKTGVPQAPSAAAWQAFGTAGNYLHFGEAPVAATGLYPGMYALNETVMCRRRAANKAWNWNVGLAAPDATPAAVGCQ